MSAICLCGVCIPYSAIIPLLLVVLQYIARPLYQMGLIPDGLAKKLGITINTASVTANDNDDDTNKNTCSSNKCCDSNTASVGVAGRMESTVSDTTTTTTPTAAILEFKSKDELTSFMNQHKGTIIFLKFTAEWCKPCKAIHPFYQQLALQHMNGGKGKDDISNKVQFATVDVDEVDKLADQYKIAMMPTFIALRNHIVLQRVSGSCEAKLEAFVKQVLSIF